MIGFANLENTLGLGMIPLALRLAAVGQGGGGVSARNSLKNLFDGLGVTSFHGKGDAVATCLITDSRRVVPGALFFAIPGLQTDGNTYINEAIDRGAVAIVSEQPKPATQHINYIHVPDVRLALAEISRRFYGNPDQALNTVGITGTNGKTTVSMLTQYLMTETPGQVGLIGTVHYDLGGRTLPSYKTTPESVDVYAMLKQMVDNGCNKAVMEVSSHALEQKRVHGVKMPIVTFLNLTQDHMDYHKTMEAYYAAKLQLFTGEQGSMPQVAVVNRDDAYGRKLIEHIPETVRLITFGMGDDAMIRAEAVKLGADGSEFQLVWPEGNAFIKTSELGCYNVSNILAALSICYAAGLDLQKLSAKIPNFPGVPGRMERVETGQKFNVLVDYAHTDDALLNALTMLKEVTEGRLFVVFGCGGNRDRDKRKLMTSVVQKWADASWATSDNPRKEAIETIFEDMRQGVSEPETIEFVENRRRAISLALDAAEPGDCVLIAGKGHETFQEFADTVVPFDDRSVARELLEIKKFRDKVF